MRTAVLLLCVILLAARTSFSTTVIPLPLEAMARTATTIVRAVCLSVRSQEEFLQGSIHTFIEFAVEEQVKGTVGRTVTVKQPGGKVGDLQSVVAGTPTFAPGEEFLLFLEPAGDGSYFIVGLFQGCYRVEEAPEGGRVVKPLVSAGQAGVPWEEFRSRLLRLISSSDPSP